jgi:hypothetical protein
VIRGDHGRERRLMSDMVEHHCVPEIVIHRDTDDDWTRISLVDDYGAAIRLSASQLRMLAKVVLSGELALITGL